MKTPINPFLEAYKVAAGEGAIIELKMRLLANKVPELQDFAYKKELVDVESQIVVHFANDLTEQDCQMLRLCRQLRNKVLHCDFYAARGKLAELGVSSSGQGSVQRVDVLGLSGRQIAEKISDVVSGATDITQFVANTSSTREGSIYGWLLELGNAGDFTKATEAFKAAALIVDRLIESTAKPALRN